jgi:hypothetical protein
MTKSPTREPPPQSREQTQPRDRNVYDYDGEYEFATVHHWTAPDGSRPSRSPIPHASPTTHHTKSYQIDFFTQRRRQ